MPSRYEYDLDNNNQWRWIALGATGAPVAVSPVGYASLQDCMHAVGLMQVQRAAMQVEGAVVAASASAAAAMEAPERSLSRLQRR